MLTKALAPVKYGGRSFFIFPVINEFSYYSPSAAVIKAKLRGEFYYEKI
jgi:hypothetical protein